MTNLEVRNKPTVKYFKIISKQLLNNKGE